MDVRSAAADGGRRPAAATARASACPSLCISTWQVGGAGLQESREGSEVACAHALQGWTAEGSSGQGKGDGGEGISQHPLTQPLVQLELELRDLLPNTPHPLQISMATAGADAGAFGELPGEGALPPDAVHVAQDPSAPQTAVPMEFEETVDAKWEKILCDFNRLGMDPFAQDFPKRREHEDFLTNPRDLPVFWGLILSRQTRTQDLDYRFRHAARLVHPDKLSQHGPEIQALGADFIKTLGNAKEAFQERIDWIQQGFVQGSGVNNLWPHQEVPEDFQSWLLTELRPHSLICNTSQGFSHALSLYLNPPRSPPLDVCKQFFDMLCRDFREYDLREILSALIRGEDDSVHGKHFALVLQSVPREGWDRWLIDQLTKLRNEEVSLNLSLFFFVDAWPASWDGITRYYSNFLLDRDDAKPFTLRLMKMVPAMMTVISTRVSQMRSLKRVAGITLTTSNKPLLPDFEFPMQTIYNWREEALPPFVGFKRLWLDFPAPDKLYALAAAQLIAGRFGAIGQPRVSRSFGDAGHLKRRAVVLTFMAERDFTHDTAFAEFVGKQIEEKNLFAAVGWESLFEVGEDCYLMRSEDLEWTKTMQLFAIFEQVVVVSKQMVVFKLAPNHTRQSLVEAVEAWNSTRDGHHILTIKDDADRMVWGRPRSQSLRPENDRHPDMPPRTAWEVVLTFEGVPDDMIRVFAEHLVQGANSFMHQRGWDGIEGLKLWTRLREGRPVNRCVLTTPSVSFARAFYLKYNGYAWTDPSGAQTIFAKLWCPMFEQELAETPALRANLGRALMSPDQSLAVGQLQLSDEPTAVATWGGSTGSGSATNQPFTTPQNQVAEPEAVQHHPLDAEAARAAMATITGHDSAAFDEEL